MIIKNSAKILILSVSILFLSVAFAGAAPTVDTSSMVNSAPASSIAITDSDLSVAVEAKINQDNAINKLGISVEAEKGVVTLSGRVSNQTQITAAVGAAKSVNGVKNVISNLTVEKAIPGEITDINGGDVIY